MFVFTNSDLVDKKYQCNIGYYPKDEKNQKVYSGYKDHKVYVVITGPQIPRSFALMRDYLSKVFETIKYIENKKESRGGSKKINYKQVAGGLKELYTTDPMAAKNKTRKMIKLLKNIQS